MRRTKLTIVNNGRNVTASDRDKDSGGRITLRQIEGRYFPIVEPLMPVQIKQIRESFQVSQAVFARLLNVSVSTVQKWEIGQKKPTGAALKLLQLVKKLGLEVVA